MRDAALIGAPVPHNLLAAFANPKVLLLGVIGLLGNGAGTGLLLSAPAVLSATEWNRFLAGVCVGLKVYIERITQMSSICAARGQSGGGAVAVVLDNLCETE